MFNQNYAFNVFSTCCQKIGDLMHRLEKVLKIKFKNIRDLEGSIFKNNLLAITFFPPISKFFSVNSLNK